MTALADPMRDDSLTEEIKITDTVRDPRLEPLDLEETQKIAVTDPRLTPLKMISAPKKQAQLIGQGQGIGFNVAPELRPDETTPEYLARQGLRTAVTGASAFLGMPGDLLKLPSMLGEAGKGLLGEKGQKIFESVTAGGLFDPKVAAKIPGSYELQEGAKALASYLGAKEGFLDPQTEGEKISDEVTKDFASLLFPLGAVRGAAVRGVNILKDTMAARIGRTLASNRPVLKAAGIAGASQAVKQVAKNTFGQDEATADNWKLGTAMVLSILTQGVGARKLGNGVRQEAQKLIPEGEVYENASALRQRVRGFIAELKRSGDVAESQKPALQEAERKLRALETRVVTPENLTDYIDQINQIRFASKATGQLVSRTPAETFELNRLFSIFNDAVDDYGRNQNPAFLSMFRDAQRALSAEAQGRNLSRNLTKAGINDVNSDIKMALGYTLGQSMSGYGGLAAIASPILKKGTLNRLRRGTEVLREISASPVLREYYLKILKASAEDNIPALSRAVQQLNREYEKEQKEFEKKVPTLQPKK